MLKQDLRFYIPTKNLTWSIKVEIDKWCLNTFGNYRHDPEIDEGWWLQDEQEYAWFVMRCGDISNRDETE